MIHSIKVWWFKHIYREWCEMKYGDGKYGKVYGKVGKRWNPMKPWYFLLINRKKPDVPIPEDYKAIIPYAYWTGDGWETGWGFLHKDGTVDAVSDIADIPFDDGLIFDWPFFMPIGVTKDFERIGFYIV